MRLAVRVLSIVVAATLLTAPAGAEDWPDRIMERMEALQLPDEALALAAVPLDGPGEARFVNADRVMNPGSTMKLLTTYAALGLRRWSAMPKRGQQTGNAGRDAESNSFSWVVPSWQQLYDTNPSSRIEQFYSYLAVVRRT